MPLSAQWEAAASAVEKAELEKLLNDRGILIFDARTRDNPDYQHDLVKEVRGAWFDKVSRPSTFAILVGAIFGIPANRI